MALTGTGDISYNGVFFDEKTNSEIKGSYKYDRAGRTVVSVTYTLHVETTVWADNSSIPPFDTGDQLENMRQSLSTPGGRLEFSAKGFGGFSATDDDFVINDPASPVKDVAWG